MNTTNQIAANGPTIRVPSRASASSRPNAGSSPTRVLPARLLDEEEQHDRQRRQPADVAEGEAGARDLADVVVVDQARAVAS